MLYVSILYKSKNATLQYFIICETKIFTNAKLEHIRWCAIANPHALEDV